MRSLVLPVACLIFSLSGVAQTFSPAPVADAATLILTTAKPFTAGDPVVLYTGASIAGCNEKYGSRVSAPVVIAATGSTAIKIQGKLSAGDVVCGNIRHGTIDSTIKAVTIAPADPSIVQTPQPPAGGDMTVQVASGQKAVAGDPIILYSGASAAGCKPPFGHPISVDDSTLAAASPTAVKLQKGLTTGFYVCGLVGHAGSNLDVVAVAVVAPSTPQFSPDPTAGDQSLKVITGGVAAAGDAVAIFTAKTDAACTAAMSGTATSVSPSVLGATSPTVINLTDKLQEGNYVCGQVTHGQQTLAIPSAKVVAAAPGKPGASGSGTPPAPGTKDSAAAPVFTVTLTNSSTITIQDTNTGAKTVYLYPVASGATCPKTGGTAIALATGTTDNGANGVAILSFAKPLATGTTLCAVDSAGNTTPVFIYIQPTQPVFTRIPSEGSTALGVVATPTDNSSAAAWTVEVQLLHLLKDTDPCDTAHGTALTLAAGTPIASQTTDKSGSATFTTSPLAAGTYVCALQTITVAGGIKPLSLADPQIPNGSVTPNLVESATDWGLVRAYFTGGMVIANDNSNFTSANQFLGLNVDKTWVMPGCATCGSASPSSTTSVITLNADSSYTISGDHISIRGAGLSSGTTIVANDSTAGITITGRNLTITPVTGGAFSTTGMIKVTSSTVKFDIEHPLSITGGELRVIATSKLTVKGAGSIVVSGGAPRGTVAHNFIPGFNSFFDARLTAIPVSSNATNTTATTTTTTTTTTAPASTTMSFIDTQKTARLGVGIYAPMLLTRWTWNNSPNALFVAPMAKIGFDTITNATQQNVILPGGASGTQTYSQVYNYRTFGGRIGHMKLSGSPNKAPEIYSYLDIGFGPFSNLESLVCNRTRYTADTPANGSNPAVPGVPIAGQPTETNYGGDCETAYPSFYLAPGGGSTDVYQVYETRKRIYRLDLEGLLKIPATPIYVGFNANLGQKAVGAGMFDPHFSAPDDLRFFFGTKFDISTLLSKLGVNLGN